MHHRNRTNLSAHFFQLGIIGLLVLAVVGLMAGESNVPRASANAKALVAVFTVPCNGGTPEANGDLLKTAMDTASGNSQADTINLTPGCVYALDDTPLYGGISGLAGLEPIANDVAGLDLTINGNGATIRRTGAALFRILEVQTGAEVVIGNVTIANGNLSSSPGGGILNNEGTLTLNDSTVSGNVANGGGGIANLNDGVLTINRSTISGNQGTLNGGGIQNNGVLTVRNSTISGNSSTSSGGGIRSSGGDFVFVNLSNVTLTNNRADSDGGGLSGTGGGISYGGASNATVRNSIITGNFVGAGSTANDCNGTLVWQSANLVGDNGDARGCTGASTIVAGAPSSVLRPLNNFGGPTQTHALRPGGQAVDLITGGNCTFIGGGTVTTDQRGFARLNAPTSCDAGAYELEAAYVVNSTNDPGAGGCTVSECTLREAINAANGDGTPSMITFDIPGAGPHVITPISSLPTITAAVTIDGLSEPDIPGGACPIFNEAPNNKLAVQIDGASAGVGVKGLWLYAGSGGSIIRGLSITRFTDTGIEIGDTSNPTSMNTLSCNYIGIKADGSDDGSDGNQYGVTVINATSNTIGGAVAGDGNVIARNSRDGVFITFNSDANTVQGNIIRNNGVLTGMGIYIGTSGADSNNNIVRDNRIYGNSRDGVRVELSTGNRITQNSIYNNDGLGIELIVMSEGVTPNDPGDSDGVSNHGQNFPVVTSAVSNGMNTTVNFTLDSNPGNYTVEFFSNPTCDASGNGEGQVYLGSASITLPGGPFTITTLPATTDGQMITATAISESDTTGSDVGDTSEFSTCFPVDGPSEPPVLSGLSLTPSSVVSGQATTLSGTATDPNLGDTLTLTINWGDGSSNTVQTVPNGSPFSFPHTYTTPNTYTVTVTVSDGEMQDAETLMITVNKANTTTNITADTPDPSGVGQTVTVNFSVAAASPGTGIPTGSVTITAANGAETCTGTLNGSGQGTCTLALNAVGDRTLTATYNGNTNFDTSTDTEAHAVVTTPVLAKSFAQESILLNGVTTLTLSITNPAGNTVPLTGVGVVDNFLPTASGLVVHTTPGATNSCATGAFNPSPGATSVTISGATIPVNTTCNFTVQVRATSTGLKVNNTSAVTSANAGTGNTATDSLQVNALPGITPVPLTRAAGSIPFTTTIANVSDSDDVEEALIIQISSDGSNFANTAMLNNVSVVLNDQSAAAGINPNAAGAVSATITTPCEATTATFTLKVTDPSNLSSTSTWTVTITPNTAPVLSYNSPRTVVAGNSLTVNPTTGLTDNGTIMEVEVLSQGGYTGGISVNSAGVVSLTGAAPVGSFTITIRATDNCEMTKDASFTLNVTCPTVTVNPPPPLASATIGAPYSQTFSATPAALSYNFAVTNGALPPGLSLASNGALTGMPTASGTYNFIVTATSATCSGSRSYSITVGCAAITFNTASPLAGGQAGTAYSQTIGVSPAGSYFFSVIGGSLPAGLSLNPTTGLLSGTPGVVGSYSFTVKAQAGGCSATQNYSLTISCPTITLNPETLPNGTRNVFYSRTFSASPSGSNYNYAVVSGTLPTGLNLNVITGVLSGTPTINGTYNFTVRATRVGTNCTNSRSYTMTIASSSP